MDHPDPKMGHIPGTLPFPGPVVYQVEEEEPLPVPSLVVDQVEEPLPLCFFFCEGTCTCSWPCNGAGRVKSLPIPSPVMDQVEGPLPVPGTTYTEPD